MTKKNKNITREAIIGLGEESFKKNYYSELQTKLHDLEIINSQQQALIETIPDILLISEEDGRISPFSGQIASNMINTQNIMRNQIIMEDLKSVIAEVIRKKRLMTYYFFIPIERKTRYFEVRAQISKFSEVLIIIRDMTEPILLEKQLRDLTRKDTLTQLYNRRYFENSLDDINEQIIEDLTIVLIDIDGLKMINDTLGHLIGDQIIIATAGMISSAFKSLGLISRVGGDEFGVIIIDQKAERIEEALAELIETSSKYLTDEGESIRISLSYGYAYHASGYVNTDFLYQEADNNMYQNKLLKEHSARNNLVKTLMKALEAKDYITEGHTSRMHELATKMGTLLKLPQHTIDRIQLLTKFHDIGKVGIPDSILKKPGPLTEDEWKVMKTHCDIGRRIADESIELKDIAHLILKHQEKWDGTGYPLGLTGEEIPIECRILTIVDSFDAMTNDRPYRKALSHQTAIEEIINCSGSQFDPVLVSVFTGIDHDSPFESN
ncbi:diguanylate cyclase [Eubacteriaceae bacterium ES3]|nr:diguanylate cyclase [Eubacteriaceae bacterium ES3]